MPSMTEIPMLGSIKDIRRQFCSHCRMLPTAAHSTIWDPLELFDVTCVGRHLSNDLLFVAWFSLCWQWDNHKSTLAACRNRMIFPSRGGLDRNGLSSHCSIVLRCVIESKPFLSQLRQEDRVDLLLLVATIVTITNCNSTSSWMRQDSAILETHENVRILESATFRDCGSPS